MIPEKPNKTGGADGAQASLEERLRDRTEELEQAKRELEELSLTDEPTGLHNLRGFLLLAEQVRKVTRRNWQTANLIYVQIEGTEEADETVVKAAAALLRDSFRDEDIVAHVGGGIFAIFASIPPERNDSVGARLRDRCAELPARGTHFSFRIGFASVSPSDERSLADLLDVAGERAREDERSHHAA